MPFTYPPRGGTITDDGLMTVSRFLNSPALLTRRLRDLTDRQFVGDRMLGQRIEAVGGMVEYEVSESMFSARTPQIIEPHAEIPLSTSAPGVSKLEAIKKVGLAEDITLEAVKRQRMSPVERKLIKLRNSVVRHFDGTVMAAIAAASVQTLTGSSWASGTTTILRQLANAKAMINDLQEGYNANALLLDNFQYAAVVSDPVLLAMMSRERVDTPVYTGEVERLAGLEIMVTNSTNLADPIVFDRDSLGGIAVETYGTPDENGVEAITDYFNTSGPRGAQYWTVAALRWAIPVITDPAAAIRILGTAVTAPV